MLPNRIADITPTLPPPAERRRAARYACPEGPAPALIVVTKSGSRWARVRDVSTTGIRLIVPAPMHPEELVLVRWAQGGPLAVALLAEVVNATAQPDGTWAVGCLYSGIYTELGSEERQRLQDLFRNVPADDRPGPTHLPLGLAFRLHDPLAPLFAGAGTRSTPAGGTGPNSQPSSVHQVRRLEDLFDLFCLRRNKLQLRRGAVDLHELAARACKAVSPLLRVHGHALKIALPAETVGLEADAARLERVLVNLLVNAARYTPPHGQIELAAQASPAEVVVRVRDTGIGIAPEVLPRLFDLPARLDEMPERTQGELGISLALVRGVVEQHGGRVEARSEGTGKGSEFIVHLPRRKGPAEGHKAPTDRPTA